MRGNPQDWCGQITLAGLTADPYPIYRRLRQEAPVAWVPAANRYLVTRHADIVELERRPDAFSAAETQSLMIRVMGQTLLRKDGAAHRRERAACEPALRPPAIKNRWAPEFSRIVHEIIDGFIDDGEADLFDRFAAPCAALSLGRLLGLYNTSAADLRTWSQALIDGTGNYGNDPEIWRRADAAAAAVDSAIDDIIPYLRAHPDESVISCMLHADDPLSRAEIGGNVKVFIGGGLNEPRDAIAVGTYALLTNSRQRELVENDPALWRAAFEETVRWVAPIGMYPRQVAKATTLGGIDLPAGARLGIVVGSGNRDETVFEDPDTFDLTRPRKSHLAFGAGHHFCLGVWASRVMVGELALPTLFKRLKNLRLTGEPVRWNGWVFRGPINLPAAWSP
jgi:cytochrome P450